MRAIHRLALGLILVLPVAIAGLPLQTPTREAAITPGSAEEAVAYYGELSTDIGFDATPDKTSIDDLLTFLGYPIAGAAVESLDPDVLMDPTRLLSESASGKTASAIGGARLRRGDILAARFFAPKIVNVSTSVPVPGWRKLVRLRTRPDSSAAKVGIQSAIVLFNFFSATEQPFSGRSVNTQVMLIAPKAEKGLYWLDFGPTQKLTLALNASFDAADLANGTGNRDYFVPDGCNACHGSPGNLRPPMINYLDTDHWFDRLDNDFTTLKNRVPVVFDAGTNDPTSDTFAPAFDVIRQFNEEALLQNMSVHADSFETEAARIWLTLHATANAPQPPIRRSFTRNGATAWQASEAEGLARLNRYCFRCHGSVRFSIFDRQTVVENAGVLRQRIAPSAAQLRIPGFKMPPDRTLDDGEIQALDSFLRNLR